MFDIKVHSINNSNERKKRNNKVDNKHKGNKNENMLWSVLSSQEYFCDVFLEVIYIPIKMILPVMDVYWLNTSLTHIN